MKGPIVALVSGACLLIGGMGGCAVGCSMGAATTGLGHSLSTPSSSAIAEATTTESLPAVAPKASDFRVDVTVTEQKCFGSAGCNYQLNVDPTYIGSATISGKWKVIYVLHGGDDPQTGNFTVDGDGVRWDSSKRIQGSSGAEFTAVVTQVLKDY